MGEIAPHRRLPVLRGGAEPEVPAIDQFEAGGLEEHGAHFSAMFSVTASDAEESVITELFAQERLHGGQAFLGAEQMGIEGANSLHDQLAPEVPDIQPIEDTGTRRLKVITRSSRATLGRDSRVRRQTVRDQRTHTAGGARSRKCDSPDQRNGAHRLFSRTSARYPLSHSPVA